MPRRLLSGFSLTMVIAAAALTGASCNSSSTSPADRSTLRWDGCERSEAQCATLAVPVDPARPDGPTLDVAVARRSARDTATRRGTVVVNPGGPGASGVDLVTRGGPGTGALDHYDVVSWDPRGVGRSRPLSCDSGLPAYRSLDWTPDDSTEAIAFDSSAQRIVTDCLASAGDLAGHLSTEDSVADLDRIREALGEDELSFVGISYGAVIGLRYAARHPDRTRAVVLDGVIDPRDDLATALGGQAAALEAQFERTLGDEASTYDRLAADAEDGRGAVDPVTLAFAVLGASYDAQGGSRVSGALRALDRGDASVVRSLADRYWAGSNYGAYLATICSDMAHPTDASGYDRLVTKLVETAPRFGTAAANELRPCAWWPQPTGPPDIGSRRLPPILVLGNTGDVATPYGNAVRVAGDLARGELVTLEGHGHTSLGRSACIDEVTGRYLDDPEAAPTRTRCSQDR